DLRRRAVSSLAVARHSFRHWFRPQHRLIRSTRHGRKLQLRIVDGVVDYAIEGNLRHPSKVLDIREYSRTYAPLDNVRPIRLAPNGSLRTNFDRDYLDIGVC